VGLVEKLLGLTLEGQLRIYYSTTDVAKTLLKTATKIIESITEEHSDK